MDWITHEEDVWFDFRGSRPEQLTPGRFYRGTVDGFADFGVFVDLCPQVTGLLHRSELDQRLESLDWDSGDTVFVQVKNVRDNGNVDLAWSIRQSEREFRGAKIHDPGGERDGEDIETDDDDGDGPVRHIPQRENGQEGNVQAAAGETESVATEDDETSVEATEDDTAAADDEGTPRTQTGETDHVDAAEDETGEEETADVGTQTEKEATEEAEAADGDGAEAAVVTDETDETDEEAPERVEVASLADRVDERVRLEAEITRIRQTSGPTVFGLEDETGTVDAAAFVEAGVRAYPDVETGDAVRLDGEVERRRGELQVETEELTVLSGDEASTVADRRSAALTSRATPDAVEPLADHEPAVALSDAVAEAATAVRRAVFEGRPVVVRHAATADGHVAGAAIERALLPLVRAEHDESDAEYHYFDRRPLDDPVYGMDPATADVTRMLNDRDRHDEALPLVVLAGVGSETESLDGLELLGVYDAERLVVDARPVDEAVAAEVETTLAPDGPADLTTGAIASDLAAAVTDDDEVRESLAHLPATSYWESPPETYVALAAEAGHDAADCRRRREAVALEAHYQSYEDKRELVGDLLFDDAAAPATTRPESEGRVGGDLAEHVSEQFRQKLDDEVRTAEANVERHEQNGVSVVVLDAEAYAHRYDFPPTTLLVDELHRRSRDGQDGAVLTLGLERDELHVRSTAAVDVREAARAAREAVPDAGVEARGHGGRIGFLAGEREAVVDAVTRAVVEQVVAVDA
ncbi:MAG: OB-fold nucleic acid binding domain-containing protein [Haloferacaceae archaeon]